MELPSRRSQSTRRSRLGYVRYPQSFICSFFSWELCCVHCIFCLTWRHLLDNPVVVCWSFTSCYLAAVLLKQFIKQHWEEDEDNFVPPVVSASEKVLRLFPVLCWMLQIRTQVIAYSSCHFPLLLACWNKWSWLLVLISQKINNMLWKYTSDGCVKGLTYPNY